jgi:hypothetical protein
LKIKDKRKVLDNFIVVCVISDLKKIDSGKNSTQRHKDAKAQRGESNGAVGAYLLTQCSNSTSVDARGNAEFRILNGYRFSKLRTLNSELFLAPKASVHLYFAPSRPCVDFPTRSTRFCGQSKPSYLYAGFIPQFSTQNKSLLFCPAWLRASRPSTG